MNPGATILPCASIVRRGIEPGSRIRSDVRDRIAREDDVECPRLGLLAGVHEAALNQHVRWAARVRGLGCAAGEQRESG